MNVAREWSVFAGGLFLLMGTSLAAAARRNAEDALSWHRQWSAATGQPEAVGDEEKRRARLIRVYRFGGLFFAGMGVGLLVSGVTGHGPFAERAVGREALFGGLFFTACGTLLGVNAWLRHGRRGPRFLDGELLDFEAPPPLGERVADVSSKLMIALFLAFGLRLLAGVTRGF